MGYGTRNNGQIKTYWPDDSDTEMYLLAGGGLTLAEIQEKINEKWPGASSENINITSESIHTDCLTYDCYDPSDWTDFIIITRTPGA